MKVRKTLDTTRRTGSSRPLPGTAKTSREQHRRPTEHPPIDENLRSASRELPLNENTSRHQVAQERQSKRLIGFMTDFNAEGPKPQQAKP